MADVWTHSQLKLLRHYPEKGGQWVADECNKIPGAQFRTVVAVRRKARRLGYIAQAEPLETNERIDAAIRRAYQSGEQGAATRCAKACKRPVWWLIKRAKQLELRPLRGRPFSEAEAGCIKANAHLPASEIQVRMRRRGFNRSAQSIREYITRKMIHPDRDRPLSARETAKLFGVDAETLTKHIRSARLIARRSGEGGGLRPTNYLIEMVEIARFVIRYPQLIDLRKVDSLWFIDMLAHYAAAASLDMHRNMGVRLAQMVRENPAIEPELVADLLGVTVSEAMTRLAEARRETMREAA